MPSLTKEEWTLIREAARKRGVKPSAAKRWYQRDTIPAKHVPTISDATGIPAYRLDPENFPRRGRAA